MKIETKSKIICIVAIILIMILIILLLPWYDIRFIIWIAEAINLLYLPVLIIGGLCLVGIITAIILAKNDKQSKTKRKKKLYKELYAIFLKNKGKAFTSKAIYNRICSTEIKDPDLEEISEILAEFARQKKLSYNAHEDQLYYFKELKKKNS